MKAASSVLAFALAAVANARTFTVYNGCPFTIWYVSQAFLLFCSLLTQHLVGLL